MSQQQQPSNPPPTGPAATAADPTFRNYTAAAATAYGRIRGSYPPALYDFVIARHTRTGGALGRILDVGCGPGNALRDLAPRFEHAVGADPGAEMIGAAEELGGVTGAGEKVTWRVAGAEELVEGGCGGDGDGKVDLLTAAMAAHWFDMPAFWKQAARLVSPGGSVAIFSKCSYFCHPSTPNAREVQRVFDDFERGVLAPYELPGNRLCREFYRDLALPWQAADGPHEFPEELFERHEWNVEGALDGEGGDDFFGGSLTVTFPEIEMLLGTGSQVQRYREAHPDEAGTEGDVVKVMLKKLQEAAGTEQLRTGSGCALLLFKRK